MNFAEIIRQKWNWKYFYIALAVKITATIIIGVILMSNANALRFEALGWEVRWNDKPQVIDKINNFKITTVFDNEVEFVNKFKESQLFLKELDYERIGIIDVSTGNSYTAIISDDGTINHVEQGLNNPETIIKANIPKIREIAENGNYMELKNQVQIPFKVKLKILLMRWF